MDEEIFYSCVFLACFIVASIFGSLRGDDSNAIIEEQKRTCMLLCVQHPDTAEECLENTKSNGGLMMIFNPEEVQKDIHQAANDLLSDKDYLQARALIYINVVGARLLSALKQNNPETYVWVVDRIYTALEKQIDDYREINGSRNIILEDIQAGNAPFDADEVFGKEMKAY